MGRSDVLNGLEALLVPRVRDLSLPETQRLTVASGALWATAVNPRQRVRREHRPRRRRGARPWLSQTVSRPQVELVAAHATGASGPAVPDTPPVPDEVSEEQGAPAGPGIETDRPCQGAPALPRGAPWRIGVIGQGRLGRKWRIARVAWHPALHDRRPGRCDRADLSRSAHRLPDVGRPKAVALAAPTSTQLAARRSMW